VSGKKRLWFGPKRFGYGVSPVSIEGWIATGLFVLLLIGWTHAGLGRAATLAGVVLLVAAFLGLIAMTYGSSDP